MLGAHAGHDASQVHLQALLHGVPGPALHHQTVGVAHRLRLWDPVDGEKPADFVDAAVGRAGQWVAGVDKTINNDYDNDRDCIQHFQGLKALYNLY